MSKVSNKNNKNDQKNKSAKIARDTLTSEPNVYPQPLPKRYPICHFYGAFQAGYFQNNRYKNQGNRSGSSKNNNFDVFNNNNNNNNKNNGNAVDRRLFSRGYFGQYRGGRAIRSGGNFRAATAKPGHREPWGKIQFPDPTVDPSAPKNVPVSKANFPFSGVPMTNMSWIKFNTDGNRLNTQLTDEDMQLEEADFVEMREFERLATYNWVIDEENFPKGTIVIPGAGKTFNTSVKTAKLKRDEWFVSDPNGYQSRNYPLEAAFRAIEKCQNQLKLQQKNDDTKFDFAKYDLFADSNSFMLLLKFCQNICGQELDRKSIRMDVQRIGQTVCLLRNEQCPVFKFNQGPVYGINFKRTVTNLPANGGSKFTGNYFHQVSGFKFGQYRIISTSKVDCIRGKVGGANSNADDLIDSFAAMLSLPRKFDDESNLHFVDFGTFDPKMEIIELRTRKVGGILHWRQYWSHTFFTTAKDVIIGRVNIDTGALLAVEQRKLPRTPPQRDRLNHLRQMNLLLRKIVTFVRDRQEGRTFALILQRDKDVKLFDRDNAEFYPDILPRTYRDRLFPESS